MYRRCESEEFFVIRNFKGVCKLCSVLKNYSFCFFITPTMFIRTSDIFISYQKYQRQRSVSEEFLYYTNQQFFEHHRHPNDFLLVTCVNTCVNASFFTPSRMFILWRPKILWSFVVPDGEGINVNCPNVWTNFDCLNLRLNCPKQGLLLWYND